MLAERSTYDALYRDFRWQIPERFNIGTAVSDAWAAREPDRVCLQHFLPDAPPLSMTYGELAARSDAFATARVLAAAVRRIGEVDLVLLGMAALDSLTSLLPAALAEELDLPALTIASELHLAGSAVRVRRDLDHVVEVLEADLPALVSVTDGINTPRFPNFQAIMAARGKPVETWGLADLGLGPGAVGDAAARTRVLEVAELAPREQEVLDTDDDGEAGTRLADFLVARGLA